MDYEAMKRTALLYEEKLKELMTQVEFKTFSVEVAKNVPHTFTQMQVWVSRQQTFCFRVIT